MQYLVIIVTLFGGLYGAFTGMGAYFLLEDQKSKGKFLDRCKMFNLPSFFGFSVFAVTNLF